MTQYVLVTESICLLILECFKTYFQFLCDGIILSVQCSKAVAFLLVSCFHCGDA